jgi:hypothetical protein
MFRSIEQYIEALLQELNQIPEERRSKLDQLVRYIIEQRKKIARYSSTSSVHTILAEVILAKSGPLPLLLIMIYRTLLLFREVQKLRHSTPEQ